MYIFLEFQRKVVRLLLDIKLLFQEQGVPTPLDDETEVERINCESTEELIKLEGTISKKKNNFSKLVNGYYSNP